MSRYLWQCQGKDLTFYLPFTIDSEYFYFITSWMTVPDYRIIAKFHELWIRHKNLANFHPTFFCLKIKFWENSNRYSFLYNIPNIPKNLMFWAERLDARCSYFWPSLGLRLFLIFLVSYSRNMRYGSLYMDTGHAFILTTYYAQQLYVWECGCSVVVSYKSSETAVSMGNNGQIFINRKILLT